MHELGILYEVVKMADRIARENQVEKVQAVQIEVGELSGCVNRFFEAYYPIIIEDFSVMKDSRLIIETVKGEALCSDCGTLYNVMKQEGKCPLCQSRDKKIISGQEFTLKNIIV